ncbi:FAD/FMN-dependent dehydrogenase [Sphaerochaeta pleomorpha str. Grapes]|uniref:FAD/FMN-dependent dehydrogenase n=1 Tax=Sphaerochaeta pleomorpha (strain ATCC BAA-1885 / DSM 22778 / Grapes) TaxID=158190 RepID=G8QT54_SPHPG|nr:FAD-linked oxidase C-terminal domain-containing protein [Sphaerochaeta pleomorpha]AEV27959.1 FAD/FMN-dependent dehydrogenase [Sphaerochaeta pleomorpha str. Grapes]
MNTYTKVTPEIVSELSTIVGNNNLISDFDRMENYGHDETSKEEYGHMPEVVVMPQSCEQVAQVMRLATRYHIPVTPRGAGSGLSGGAIPLFGGIVLSVEKMNKVLEIDEKNLTVTAEAGIITNELNNQVIEHKLFFAGYPMSLETCFLGGNIAENAGGGRAVKYGVTGRYVLGLEIVTPDGRIVNLGGKVTKDVSGYDLKQLYIGSEGTLGIITKATIKLLGLPTAKADLLVPFKTAEEAIAVVSVIMTKGIVPTSIEFMDRTSLQMSCNYLNETLPLEKVGAMLLIELDGSEEKQVEADMISVGDLCEANGAMEVYIAEDKNTQERIWSVRRNIAEALKVYSPVQSLEDIVVPIGSIPLVLPKLTMLSEKYGVTIPCYGHAGDGNLHATIVKNPESTMEHWHEIEPMILRELYAFIVTELGGKISGEHGIGIKRREFLREVISDTEYDLFCALKKAFDPQMIMNPGKIIRIQ